MYAWQISLAWQRRTDKTFARHIEMSDEQEKSGKVYMRLNIFVTFAI